MNANIKNIGGQLHSHLTHISLFLFHRKLLYLICYFLLFEHVNAFFTNHKKILLLLLVYCKT